MKTTYGNNNRMIIATRSDLGKKRKGKVFNPNTNQFDLETWIGQVNPANGDLWCEDIPDWVVDENGKLQKVLGKWVERDLVQM